MGFDPIALIKAPFLTNFSMQGRCGLIAINSGANLLIPGEADHEIIPMSSGPLGFLDKTVGFLGFALLWPGLIFTPIGAALFGAVLLFSALRSVNSLGNLIGSICSMDLGGILKNGLCLLGNLITFLPFGKLFSVGPLKMLTKIKADAVIAGGGFQGHMLAGAENIYGTELAYGVTRTMTYNGATRTVQTGGLHGLLNPTSWFNGLKVSLGIP